MKSMSTVEIGLMVVCFLQLLSIVVPSFLVSYLVDEGWGTRKDVSISIKLKDKHDKSWSVGVGALLIFASYMISLIMTSNFMYIYTDKSVVNLLVFATQCKASAIALGLILIGFTLFRSSFIENQKSKVSNKLLKVLSVILVLFNVLLAVILMSLLVLFIFGCVTL